MATAGAPITDAPTHDHLETARTGRTGEIAYATYGDPAGSPVVFLHGTPGSSRLGALFDDAAAREGVRLLAPERPGSGTATPDPGYTVDDGAALVEAVLDDAGVRSAGLVAFSGGTPYALAAALALPGRVTAVDLVAGATPPSVAEDTPVTQRLLGRLASTAPVVLSGLLRSQAWLARRLGPSVVVDQYTTGDADGVADHRAATVAADFRRAVDRGCGETVAEFASLARPWGLPYDDLAVDVRLWHGDDDANVPLADARRFATALPGAELSVLDGEDHLGTLLSGVPRAMAAHR